MCLDGKSDHVHLFEGSLINSASRYRAVRRPRHGSLRPEPQNSCLQMVFWFLLVAAWRSAVVHIPRLYSPGACIHTLAVYPSCTLFVFGRGTCVHTLTICKYTFLGRWYVYTHLGSYHIYTYLVLRPRYVYTHFGSSDVGVCVGLFSAVRPKAPGRPQEAPRRLRNPPGPQE